MLEMPPSRTSPEDSLENLRTLPPSAAILHPPDLPSKVAPLLPPCPRSVGKASGCTQVPPHSADVSISGNSEAQGPQLRQGRRPPHRSRPPCPSPKVQFPPLRRRRRPPES